MKNEHTYAHSINIRSATNLALSSKEISTVFLNVYPVFMLIFLKSN